GSGVGGRGAGAGGGGRREGWRGGRRGGLGGGSEGRRGRPPAVTRSRESGAHPRLSSPSVRVVEVTTPAMSAPLAGGEFSAPSVESGENFAVECVLLRLSRPPAKIWPPPRRPLASPVLRPGGWKVDRVGSGRLRRGESNLRAFLATLACSERHRVVVGGV